MKIILKGIWEDFSVRLLTLERNYSLNLQPASCVKLL